MSLAKIEDYYCKKCKKKTKHKISNWAYTSREGHSHMCTICGYGETWEEDHGNMLSGKYINFKYIEDKQYD